MPIVAEPPTLRTLRTGSARPCKAPFVTKADWLGTNTVLIWIHVIATGLYIGTTVGLPIFALRTARSIADPLTKRRQIASVLRIYDPLAIALLGVMVMTGAWLITGYKQNLAANYFDSFGQHLAWKLLLAFFVVMFGTYISMGLGHRIVREDDWSDEVDPEKLSSMLRRLSGAAWCTAAVTVATVAIAAGR